MAIDYTHKPCGRTACEVMKEAGFVLNDQIIKNELKLAEGNNRYMKKNYASIKRNT
jgi:hypothetical protein